MMMSIEECRNYDLVKETFLKYFGQDSSVYQTPPPTKFSGRNDRPQCERRERERAERAAQREKQTGARSSATKTNTRASATRTKAASS